MAARQVLVFPRPGTGLLPLPRRLPRCRQLPAIAGQLAPPHGTNRVARRSFFAFTSYWLKIFTNSRGNKQKRPDCPRTRPRPTGIRGRIADRLLHQTRASGVKKQSERPADMKGRAARRAANKNVWLYLRLAGSRSPSSKRGTRGSTSSLCRKTMKPSHCNARPG